jgi:predicted O-methyltransferase YrrM
MTIKEYYPKFFELWTEGYNNLLHHHFSFGFNPENILIFFTSPAPVCRSIFSRLLQLYPDTNYTVVLNRNQMEFHAFPETEHIDIVDYPEDTAHLEADFVSQNILPKINMRKIDIVLFCYQTDLRHNADPHQIFEANSSYRNLHAVSGMLNNPHTYFVGFRLKVHHINDLFPKKTINTITGDYDVPDSLMSREELQTLYECARLAPRGSMILEIGHYLGGSTICLGKGALDGNRNLIATVDNHSSSFPGTREIFLENIEKYALHEKVTSYFMSVDEFLYQIWPAISVPLGLLFIDSDKEFSHILSCCLFWSKYIIAGGYLILEDYSSNPGVMEAAQVFLREEKEFKIIAEHHPMLVMKKS